MFVGLCPTVHSRSLDYCTLNVCICIEFSLSNVSSLALSCFWSRSPLFFSYITAFPCYLVFDIPVRFSSPFAQLFFYFCWYFCFYLCFYFVFLLDGFAPCCLVFPSHLCTIVDLLLVSRVLSPLRSSPEGRLYLACFNWIGIFSWRSHSYLPSDSQRISRATIKRRSVTDSLDTRFGI